VECDAIVIGAGAAGLAAARCLAARAFRVIVLEARDRVGGRAFSVPTPRSLTPAELGAEFIHGRGLETMALLREASLAAVDTGGDSWRCTARGDLERDEEEFLSAATLFGEANSLMQDESVETFLRRFAGDPLQRDRAEAARQFVEGFDAADPAIASARAIAFEWRSGTDWSSTRPIGGYAPLFACLQDDCVARGVDVRLSTIVTGITWQRGAVDVQLSAAHGAGETLRTRAVVITLPAGVLQERSGEGSVTFHPQLPSTKYRALEKIVMGDVVKVALLFESPFWENVHGGRYYDAGFFRGNGPPFGVYWTQVPVRTELVVAWAGGPRATALRAHATDDLVARARDTFGELLGAPDECAAAFDRGYTHDWRRDPFSRGAYTYLAVGGEGAREALAAPLDDTLFFAGEGTSLDGQAGTVNGALESGVRAAAEVAECLNRRS